MSENAWTPFSWHCPNCGQIVTGYKNKNGDIKVECQRCHAVMVRKVKKMRSTHERHESIDIYMPSQEEGDLP